MGKAIAITALGIVLLLAVVWWVRRNPKRVETSFLMPIDDAFALTEEGKVVVVGIVKQGKVVPGDALTLKTPSARIAVTVEELEAFRQPVASAKAGDRVGIMLQGATKEQVEAGSELVSR